MISFSKGKGAAERGARRPRSCRNTGKLINCSNLSRGFPPLPLPLRVPLSAGIKDPHKFHSARPSTLARARTGDGGALHPRKRSAPARASGVASRWLARHSSLRNFERKSGITLSRPPLLVVLFLSLSLSRRNARDIRPSDKRHNVIYGGYVATTGKKRPRSAATRPPTRFPLFRDRRATNPRVFPREFRCSHGNLFHQSRTLCECNHNNCRVCRAPERRIHALGQKIIRATC